MVGFSLRGGIVFLTVPILVLPTSVEVRLLLGDNLSSTGLTPGFFLLVAALSLATLGLALLVLYVLARCELAALTRFVNATSDRARNMRGRRRAACRRDAHQAVTSRLFVVEAVALLADPRRGRSARRGTGSGDPPGDNAAVIVSLDLHAHLQ